MVLKGQRDLLEKLQKDEDLAANLSMQQGFTDMDLLFTYLEAFGAAHTVSFDLSLARGMSCSFRVEFTRPQADVVLGPSEL